MPLVFLVGSLIIVGLAAAGTHEPGLGIAAGIWLIILFGPAMVGLLAWMVEEIAEAWNDEPRPCHRKRPLPIKEGQRDEGEGK